MRTVVASSAPADPLILDAHSLGAAIRHARTSAGITLADAALAIGVSRQTMVNIEAGQGAVALPTVLLAARELGVALLAVPGAEKERARRAILAARVKVAGDGA
jgi:DNA-binding XRE family transcriptional regulator